MPSHPARSRPIPNASPLPAGAQFVVVSLTDLREILAEVANDNAASRCAPALLDRAGLSRALGVSLSKVDQLRREGCPVVQLGVESPRFRFEDVLAWLKDRADASGGNDAP
jgi:hypothetical protein